MFSYLAQKRGNGREENRFFLAREFQLAFSRVFIPFLEYTTQTEGSECVPCRGIPNLSLNTEWKVPIEWKVNSWEFSCLECVTYCFFPDFSWTWELRDDDELVVGVVVDKIEKFMKPFSVWICLIWVNKAGCCSVVLRDTVMDVQQDSMHTRNFRGEMDRPITHAPHTMSGDFFGAEHFTSPLPQTIVVGVRQNNKQGPKVGSSSHHSHNFHTHFRECFY